MGEKYRMEAILIKLKPVLVILILLFISMAFKAFMKWTEESPKIKSSGRHYWGENEKTHNIVKKCSKCNGIFHGEEFERCEKCGSLLVGKNAINRDLNRVVITNHNNEIRPRPSIGKKTITQTTRFKELTMTAKKLDFDVMLENSGFAVIENGKQVRFCFSESQLEDFLSKNRADNETES